MKARNPIVIHYVHDMKRATTFYTVARMDDRRFRRHHLALHILPAPTPD